MKNYIIEYSGPGFYQFVDAESEEEAKQIALSREHDWEPYDFEYPESVEDLVAIENIKVDIPSLVVCKTIEYGPNSVGVKD